MRKATVDALAAPQVRERLDKDGAQAVGSTPEEFSAFIKRRARALEGDCGGGEYSDQLSAGFAPAYEFKSTGTDVAARFSGMATCSSRSFRRCVNSGGNSSR